MATKGRRHPLRALSPPLVLARRPETPGDLSVRVRRPGSLPPAVSGPRHRRCPTAGPAGVHDAPDRHRPRGSGERRWNRSSTSHVTAMAVAGGTGSAGRPPRAGGPSGRGIARRMGAGVPWWAGQDGAGAQLSPRRQSAAGAACCTGTGGVPAMNTPGPGCHQACGRGHGFTGHRSAQPRRHPLVGAVGLMSVGASPRVQPVGALRPRARPQDHPLVLVRWTNAQWLDETSAAPGPSFESWPRGRRSAIDGPETVRPAGGRRGPAAAPGGRPDRGWGRWATTWRPPVRSAGRRGGRPGVGGTGGGARRGQSPDRTRCSGSDRGRRGRPRRRAMDGARLAERTPRVTDLVTQRMGLAEATRRGLGMVAWPSHAPADVGAPGGGGRAGHPGDAGLIRGGGGRPRRAVRPIPCTARCCGWTQRAPAPGAARGRGHHGVGPFPARGR